MAPQTRRRDALHAHHALHALHAHHAHHVRRASETSTDASTAEPLPNGATPHMADDTHHAPGTDGGRLTNGDGTTGEAPDDTEHVREAAAEGAGKGKGEHDAAAKIVQPRTDEPSPPSSKGTKRKASTSEPTAHSPKVARHAAPSETGSRNTTPATLSPAGRVRLLNFILSPASLPLVRPKDEVENLRSRPNGGAKTRTYATSPFTPFEELLNALILSRPISHMLGLRSIRTLFNPPHNLMSPKLIRDIGAEGVQQALDEALDEARTQHRQKIANEIVLLADAVTDVLGEDHFDVSLERVREECGHDVDKERAMLQKNVKGLGKTGLDIFGRRIQGSWGEWYPFADQKTLDACGMLGLPADTEELKNMLDEHWQDLNAEDVIGDGEEKMRRVFVRVLERTIGAHLEGNLDVLRAKGAGVSERAQPLSSK